MNEGFRCTRTDCFACTDNKCMALTEKLRGNCPFFKTKDQAMKDKQQAYDRIVSLPGGKKLYEKYNGTDATKDKWRR